MKWKVGLGIFVLGIMSNAHAVTMFYTEIRASTITNQAIFSLKELPNKNLVFLSRGDQSLSHFAIGFLDTIGQLVDYVTYNSNDVAFTSYQMSISPDGTYGIISGTALGSNLIIFGWRDPRIMSINLNTKSIIWARNMGPGCLDGSGHSIEVIDNSTAIIGYMNYNSDFLCSGAAGVSVIEKVNLNSYNVIYRKAIRKSGSGLDIHKIYKISKFPGNQGIGVLAGNYVGSESDYLVKYIPSNLIFLALNSGNVVWFRKENKGIGGLIASAFRNVYTYNSGYIYESDIWETAYILSTSDSGLLIAGINYPPCNYIPNCRPTVEEEQAPDLTFGLVRMVVVKFDKNGNIKWSKTFYSNSFSVQPNGLAEVSDGYIVGAVVGHYEYGFYEEIWGGPEKDVFLGYRKGYFRFYHPAIIKINKDNGNIIWAYKYIPINDVVNPSNRIAFSWLPSFDNILITQDSGIVIGGSRQRNTITSPPTHMSFSLYNGSMSLSFDEQYAWILKTDKNGNTCPSVQRQSLNLAVENYNYVIDNSTTYYTQDYNFTPQNWTPTQTTGLYYTNNNCYITPVSNNESSNCSSKEFKLMNNKIIFEQEREFRIYDLSGKLVYGGRAKEYVINRKGIYILKINNITYKILIK